MSTWDTPLRACSEFVKLRTEWGDFLAAKQPRGESDNKETSLFYGWLMALVQDSCLPLDIERDTPRLSIQCTDLRIKVMDRTEKWPCFHLLIHQIIRTYVSGHVWEHETFHLVPLGRLAQKLGKEFIVIQILNESIKDCSGLCEVEETIDSEFQLLLEFCPDSPVSEPNSRLCHSLSLYDRILEIICEFYSEALLRCSVSDEEIAN